MKRFFNQSERNTLYLLSGGKCSLCGTPLKEGWHADHIVPFSLQGNTELINGQALCPTCNLKKGGKLIMAHEEYVDEFEPRVFQRQLIDAVVNNHAAGKKVTVGIASPGSGKTLAYQAAATSLLRDDAIDVVAAFAPRVTLATQCELDYRCGDDGHYKLFDERMRLESILHKNNRPPMTAPGATRTGYVSTYASLVSDPRVHLQWAREHAGRFLLIGDEAQFLGARGGELDAISGTKAGDYFLEMHELAAHTIMLTGTERRADNGELVLAQYEQRDDGKKYLVPDVRARYSDGIAQGYLRRFEATKIDSDVERLYLTKELTKTQALSENGDQLRGVLEQEKVWKPLADQCIEQLRNARASSMGYKGLIACQRQDHARQVHKYLKSRGVKAALAVSDDNGATESLDRFKFDDAEILVTVRMAFLGYDCKDITVVGLLTNYRDFGHLEQLVGRGLRVKPGIPADRQICRIVAPDDPAMSRFLEHLQQENDLGLGERKKRKPEEVDTPWPPPPPPEPTIIVQDAELAGITATGHDGYVDPNGFALVQAVHDAVPASRQFSQAELFKIWSIGNDKPMPTPPVRQHGVRLTVQQQVKKLTDEADGFIKDAASMTVTYYPGNPAWLAQLRELRNDVNRQVGVRSVSQVTTLEDAKRYRDCAARLAGMPV